MDEVQKSQKKAIGFLKKINSLDDLKQNKDEMLAHMEGIFNAALKILNECLNESVPPEDKAKVIAKFQDDEYLFSKEIQNEMSRIDSLPGALEFYDSFQKEMDGRLQPLLDDIGEKVTLIMESMMGGVMEEMGGIMEGMMEGIGKAMDAGSVFESDEGKLDVGKGIFEVQSVEDLKNNKETIIGEIVDQLEADLEVLRYHKEMKVPSDEMMLAGQRRIRTRQVLLRTELEREFERISALPDAWEYVESVKEEITGRIDPLIKAIMELLTELNKDG
jgi:hypothetical protein